MAAPSGTAENSNRLLDIRLFSPSSPRGNFVTACWYEITLGCSGAPVHIFERKIQHTELEEAYRRFVSSDRGKQAGFVLAQQIFSMGGEEHVKNSEE